MDTSEYYWKLVWEETTKGTAGIVGWKKGGGKVYPLYPATSLDLTSSLTGPFLHRQPVPARAPYIVSQLCSPFILTGYSKGKNHGLPAVRLSMTFVTETGDYPKKVIQTVEICQIIDRAVQVSKSWLKKIFK